MPSLNDFAQIRTDNVALARLTSLGVGGPARFFFEPRTVAELSSLCAALASHRIPLRVIGGGTNVVAADDGFPGAVLRLAGEFAGLTFDGLCASAGAALPLPVFVHQSARRGLSGAQGLVGIPGTVGGALIMNAGGQWGNISQIVSSVRVMTPEGTINDLNGDRIAFSYRDSSLHGLIVLSGVFALTQSDPDAVQSAAQAFLSEKRASQDLASRSAGCIFKNPPSGPSAGALIDQAGLKGRRVGGAAVSSVHANFIINTGSAAAADVLSLANVVRAVVREKFGVELDFEVQLW